MKKVAMEDLTLRERIKAKSPKIFKKITNSCVAIGVIGGAIMAVASGGILLPAYIITISGYMVTAGVVGGAVSKLTVEKNTDTED